MDALMNLTSIAIEFNGVIHAIGLPHTSLNDTTYAIVGCSGILILKGKKKIVIFLEGYFVTLTQTISIYYKN